MSLWEYDGKSYADTNGNTYQVIGERILVNESTILKSWFGCVTVKDISIIGSTLHVKFETGELTLNGIREIKPKEKSDRPREEKVLGICMLFTPGCPKENLKALQKKGE